MKLATYLLSINKALRDSRHGSYALPHGCGALPRTAKFLGAVWQACRETCLPL
jgi:hypothetical protein